MISRIVKVEVCVILRRLRWITQTEALLILDILRKPNSIIVLLYVQKLERKQSHFVYAFKNMEFSRAF
jgi:hypothetical protein